MTMTSESSALERDPGAALFDVERVRHAHDPGFEGQRVPGLAV